MYPILGRYGSFFLYSYSVVLGLGLIATIGLMHWQTRPTPPPRWLDGILFSLAVGFVGGRLGFIGGEWAYFHQRPLDMVRIWQGGLTYHGVLLAALLAFWGWCLLGKRSLSQYAPLLALAIALLSACGWLACYLEGCAYGQEMVVTPYRLTRWLTADLPDTFGIYQLRYQTQLLGIIFSFLIFLWVLRQNGRWPPLTLFWWTLFLLSSTRVLIDLGRGDVVPQVAHIRIDLILDAMLALVSLVLLQYTWRKKQIT